MSYRMIRHRWFLHKKWPYSKRMASVNVESQGYERAISALNSLQTNAEVLSEIRKEPGYIARKFAETGSMFNRVGIDVTDLDQLNIIHISGTKGKGSVCAMCESILRVQGLKTGFYSSPHLVEVRERIRLNGQPLSKESFASYFWGCYDLLKKDKDKPMPSYFMFLTIMAYKVFLSEQVDVAITEVGIGGTFDCTNHVQHPKVCAVTSLGYDHTDVLGKTLSEIASHKAGIFKCGVPAFTSKQSPEALKTLLSRSKELGSSSLLISPEPASYPNTIWDIGIPGSHQCENASLAVQVCRQWLMDMKMWTPENSSCHEDEVERINDIPVAHPFVLPSTFVKALKECYWPGRCQVIKQEGVSYFLDGAHTIRSLQSCRKWFQEASIKEETSLQVPVIRVLLFNFMGRRDGEKLLSELLDLPFNHTLFCPNYIYSSLDDSDHTFLNESASRALQRCYDNEAMWQKLTGICGHVAEVGVSKPILMEDKPRSKVFTCISEAIEWIGGVKDQQIHVQVLVCGSLHLVGGVMKLIGCTAEKLY